MQSDIKEVDNLEYKTSIHSWTAVKFRPESMLNNYNIKNIFLDRDGTIIQDMHYLHHPDQIMLIPGAAGAMKEMNELGLKIFLATNQSGIGRNYFTEEEYHLVQEKLLGLLTEKGIKISGCAFCPHSPDDHCDCRKPATGIWKRLSAEHDLRPQQTVMVGDKKSDILFARNSGFAACALVLTGQGEKNMTDFGIDRYPEPWFEPEPHPLNPSVVAKDIYSAWNWIKQRFIDVN
ncbi:MAG: D-glycero-alpha-D-manno-heptose-1,7-bisphosphate 7-phosphatase [Desulfonatronovibrio sp.]